MGAVWPAFTDWPRTSWTHSHGKQGRCRSAGDFGFTVPRIARSRFGCVAVFTETNYDAGHVNHRDHVLNCDLQSTPEGSLSLNEPTSAIGRSPVWLVLFDPLPEIPAVSPVSSAESQAQAAGPAAVFECLESRSVVFEQYLIQDVRESATLDDYLGGADAVGNWGRCLAGAGVGAV
ncbi:MAG: hypothetical protein RLZZ436_4540, partial [Planctomycetota bacterium]